MDTYMDSSVHTKIHGYFNSLILEWCSHVMNRHMFLCFFLLLALAPVHWLLRTSHDSRALLPLTLRPLSERSCFRSVTFSIGRLGCLLLGGYIAQTKGRVLGCAPKVVGLFDSVYLWFQTNLNLEHPVRAYLHVGVGLLRTCLGQVWARKMEEINEVQEGNTTVLIKHPLQSLALLQNIRHLSNADPNVGHGNFPTWNHLCIVEEAKSKSQKKVIFSGVSFCWRSKQGSYRHPTTISPALPNSSRPRQLPRFLQLHQLPRFLRLYLLPEPASWQ